MKDVYENALYRILSTVRYPRCSHSDNSWGEMSTPLVLGPCKIPERVPVACSSTVSSLIFGRLGDRSLGFTTCSRLANGQDLVRYEEVRGDGNEHDPGVDLPREKITSGWFLEQEVRERVPSGGDTLEKVEGVFLDHRVRN